MSDYNSDEGAVPDSAEEERKAVWMEYVRSRFSMEALHLRYCREAAGNEKQKSWGGGLVKVYQIGLSTRFAVIGKECLGCKCFAPGMFDLLEDAPPVFCCLTNAHDGCPDDRGETPELLHERKAVGWRVSL